MLPRALTAALGSVDKGMTAGEFQAAWFGDLQPTDGFPAGVLADSCGLLDIPVTRVENRAPQATTPSAMRCIAVGGGYVDVALVVGADKIARTSARRTFWDWMGDGPRHGVGLPARA